MEPRWGTPPFSANVWRKIIPWSANHVLLENHASYRTTTQQKAFDSSYWYYPPSRNAMFINVLLVTLAFWLFFGILQDELSDFPGKSKMAMEHALLNSVILPSKPPFRSSQLDWAGHPNLGGCSIHFQKGMIYLDSWIPRMAFICEVCISK